ncbi:hypothetical protein CWI39_1258p0010 [Hamiltosporidium magnivora]|uniref:Uncharacterized protein n=1 Tax=Hamiltosporidium magnivora TaxID=148818 RepID=A0A4Q9L475_9MICR|nr:hypothetical protein CWI39_1258p0010 [Hamiltosporidium magnivora]
MGNNRKQWIKELETNLCTYLYSYVDNIQRQFIENSKYDLHLLSITQGNKTEDLYFKILKSIRMKEFFCKFLIASYSMKQILNEFSIFSFYERKTYSIMRIPNKIKETTKSSGKFCIFSNKFALSLISRYIRHLWEIYNKINSILTEYEVISIIQPIEYTEYNIYTITEILRSNKNFYNSNFALVLEKKYTDDMRERIIKFENLVPTKIEKYEIYSLQYFQITDFFARIKKEICKISFLCSDLNWETYMKPKNIFDDSNSYQYYSTDLDYKYQDTILKMKIYKFSVVKDFAVITSIQNIKEIGLCRFSTNNTSKKNGKHVQSLCLYLFLYKIDISKSYYPSFPYISLQIEYDLKIVVNINEKMYPDDIIYKIKCLRNIATDSYSIKSIQSNVESENITSEKKKLIEIFQNITAEQERFI